MGFRMTARGEQTQRSGRVPPSQLLACRSSHLGVLQGGWAVDERPREAQKIDREKDQQVLGDPLRLCMLVIISMPCAERSMACRVQVQDHPSPPNEQRCEQRIGYSFWLSWCSRVSTWPLALRDRSDRSPVPVHPVFSPVICWQAAVPLGEPTCQALSPLARPWSSQRAAHRELTQGTESGTAQF